MLGEIILAVEPIARHIHIRGARMMVTIMGDSEYMAAGLVRVRRRARADWRRNTLKG